MLNRTRKQILAVSFALLAFLVSAIPVAAQSNHYNLRMENNTGYDIYQVRMSSVNDRDWERDILGSRIFGDGTSFTIAQISPGYYDVAFVDEDADVCVVHNVSIYSNLNWNLSQTWLLNCER
jgi:hypothetical protein